MAIVNEHAAPLGPEDPGSEPPKPQEEDIIRYCKKLLERFKLGTNAFRNQWPTNYKFVMGGQQWPIERPEWRFSEVVNTTWADIMTELGIQTDARPKVDFVPTEPSDIPFCDLLKEVNDINWNKYPWLDKVAENVLDSKIYHVSHTEVRWNPDLEGGLGDVEHVVLNPYGCYWDTLASSEEDLRAFIYVEPVPTEKLKKDHPDKSNEIKSDIDTVASQMGDTGSWGIDNADTNTDRISFNLSSGTRGRRPAPTNRRFGGEPMTLLVRCWLKDESLEEMVEEKPIDGGKVEKSYLLKKRYPEGRYVEFCNNVLLEDGPNGVKIGGEIVPYKHGEIPIVRWVNYAYPREYAGETEVTHKMGPQIVTNYVWSFMLDTMKQASNPKEIFSAANREPADKSSNEPGQVLVLPDVNGYRREPGLGIPPNLQGLLQESFGINDKIGGLMDVMRGAVDPAVKSGVLMDSYVEAAQVRPRLKSRNVERSLHRLGTLDAALYLQFYTAPRTYRLTNKQGWPEFVSFFIQDDGNGNSVARISRSVPNESGQYAMQPEQQVPIKGLPDIKVTTGSSIPFQKGVQYQRAKELFQLGAIDQTALLNEIDFPKKDEIIQRMQEQAAQAAANQPPSGGG